MRLFTDPNAIEAVPLSTLPQPLLRIDETGIRLLSHYSEYKYVQGDRILDKKGGILKSTFSVGQHVWVCLSRGQRRQQNDGNMDGKKGLEDESSPVSLNKQRCKLFSRAVVDSDEDDERDSRICVRYPHGSTYRVRSSLLLHIIDESVTSVSGPHVVIFAETSEYRRACIVHTGPNESFCEIGCACGITCQKVKLYGHADRLVVGLDKSEQEILKAKASVPDCTFATCDILRSTEEWLPMVDKIPQSKMDGEQGRSGFCPTVVAIDINGNRELQAVLSCLQVAMDVWRPRLILVKSRSLYHGIGRNVK
jgi:hypothetical protein